MAVATRMDGSHGEDDDQPRASTTSTTISSGRRRYLSHVTRHESPAERRKGRRVLPKDALCVDVAKGILAGTNVKRIR